MKLKTLNDLNFEQGGYDIKRMLKAEAIRCRLKFNEWHKKGILHSEFSKLSGKKLNVKNFIEWYFNLTEEDLE